MKYKAPKDLFEYTYPNGNRVHVTDRGITLWDDFHGRWVMDASTLTDDNSFIVTGFSKYPFNIEVQSLYLPLKTKAKRKTKRKK